MNSISTFIEQSDHGRWFFSPEDMEKYFKDFS